MPAIAMTDHGVMYGAIDFYQTLKKDGIKPIIGCETYTTTGSRHDRKTDSNGKSGINHLVLLATDVEGYHNLAHLVSLAQLEGFYYKPRIDREILARYSKGLIGLSACLKGEVATCLADKDEKGARNIVGELTDIFGKGSFYLETMDHGIPEQRVVNKMLGKLSKDTSTPIVATNDVHYLKKEHAEAHEVLLCLQTQTVMSDPKRMRYKTQEFYMKTREEMEPLFREFPGALDLTIEIAERCNVELDFNTLHFPTFKTPDGINQRQYLTDLCKDGIRKLYKIKNPDRPRDAREKEVMQRFEMELDIIDKTGFINYFLVVWDFVRFAKEQNIPVGPGRGSGGGSLLAYVLGITTIDPLHYSLIFERFLNPERVSPPDFDIDFCQSRRGEVIEYVRDKYGRENVAQIITFGSLGAKSVIRDVGRALELPYIYCDKLAKMVPDDPKIKLDGALKTNPEFQKTYQTDQDCRRILDYAFVLEGLYRNPGTHAAGVVIGEKPLREIIPLARDKDKQTITQYTMEPLGDLGLLKMDFLGLKTLTVIQETVHLLKQYKDIEIDIDSLPMDDKNTYQLLSRGDTVGVFQLESGGMRDLVRRVGMNRIEDLIAMIALYRPGPMNMLPAYIDRKSGKANVVYDHPLMQPILEETYGVMVYQEQVQKCANVLAGYSLGEADILRRAMGKKKASVMEQQREKFIKGCIDANKIDAKKAGRIFDTMAEFAGYGFNKAHSTGYAIISYQTAYLKANYPSEFMAALLSSEMGNTDKLPVFTAEAKEMGLDIKSPDINSSMTRFIPEGSTIKFGLAGIKNVGEAAAESLVAEREKNGPYKDMVDFCARLDGQSVNRKVVESLVKCGAFDKTGMHRARLFNGVDFAMSRASSMMQDKKTGQGSLFDLMDTKAQVVASETLPDCEEWHESELLACERELLGMYMSGHPLTQHEFILSRFQLSSVKTLANIPDGEATRLGGIITTIKKTFTKAKKEPMAIIQLEDIDGSVEVLVPPESFQRYGAFLENDSAIMVCGDVNNRGDQPKLYASEIYPLHDVPKHFSKRLSLHIPSAGLDNAKLELIKDILRVHPGNTPVIICLLMPSGEKVFLETDKTFSVVPDKNLYTELEKILGEKGLYLEIDPSPCKKGKQKKRW